MEKLTFNKRIALTKTEAFDLIQKEQMDKSGNTMTGYYSIKTIMLNLNPLLLKYDIDLDVVISGKTITCVWIDCLSELTRIVPIEINEIDKIEKLPAMQNIIQSQGAVLTYYRRYALTNVLNLNATDLIENNTNVNNTNANTNTVVENANYTITDKQLKRLFAIMNSKNKTEDEVDKYISVKKWNIKSKKELTKSMYDELCKALENS